MRAISVLSFETGTSTRWCLAAAALRRRVRKSAIGSVCICLLKRDRKSTRLNSSHQIISYAVFCLKKKKSEIQHNRETLISRGLCSCHQSHASGSIERPARRCTLLVGGPYWHCA